MDGAAIDMWIFVQIETRFWYVQANKIVHGGQGNSGKNAQRIRGGLGKQTKEGQTNLLRENTQ